SPACRTRTRYGSLLLCLGNCCRTCPAACHPASGRYRGGRCRKLRGHPPITNSAVCSLGHSHHLCITSKSHRVGKCPGRSDGATGLVRNPDQPAIDRGRYTCVGRTRPRPRCAAGGRQHIRLPRIANPNNTGCRRRSAFHHQIHWRPLRCARRCNRRRRRDLGRPTPCRTFGLPAVRRRSRGRTPGCVPDFSRAQTLGVRMKQHCENAGIIAEWLQSRAVVKNVYYPGLESHPTHHLAREQMSGFGGVISLQVHGGEAAARRVAEATKTFLLSVSLGGIESLISHPATMTHGSTRDTPQAPPADVVRLSVGIEDA